MRFIVGGLSRKSAMFRHCMTLGVMMLLVHNAGAAPVASVGSVDLEIADTGEDIGGLP